MPDYSSSSRDPRRNNAERPVRSGSHPQGQRPQGQRSQGQRPAQGRPSGSRPSQGRRPAPRKRKRRRGASPAVLSLAVIAVIALVVAGFLFFGSGGKDVVQPQATPVPADNNSGRSNATVSSRPADSAAPATGEVVAPADSAAHSTIGDWLEDDDSDLAPMAKEDMVQVTDLSINPDLPSDWVNILLLGTDQRTLTESCRTDTMIICSINPKTGEVKLTSVMRDLAVDFDDLGENNGTYRINAANYFGGPEYAIKTINECFGLNIEYYVVVNFFGFQKIAQALGGIDVDITEAEMVEINKNAVDQAWYGYHAGVDESDQENVYLETYGPKTHLNGRQTLAYARIRSVDSDYSRAERQRTVLVQLMTKLMGRNPAEILALLTSLSDSVTTNMSFDTIFEISMCVVESGITDVESFRLPLNGTYKTERRNEKEMFYDCDWTTNSRELYNFIYE